ncbi:MAG TPA: type II toxin-antitoxin system PemK/MazF family toxin [Acetobacteraceae bacterium]|nr:type II toxin-antitoxin system PemK/MazF family toxin [Acetobacteraceae bacterium]
MKRGDVVTVAVSGDYGKPRPALVIQSDAFAALPSVTVLRLSSEIIPAHLTRITIEPTSANGLRFRSQVMLDKAISVPRAKIGKTVGCLDTATMRAVSRGLIAFFDLDEMLA